MSASSQQRSQFGWAGDEAGNAYFQQVATSKMRDWYRRGQKAFRAMLKIGSAPQIEHFNDLMDLMKGYEREGFLMGWQSDAWAHANNQPFSVGGTTHGDSARTFSA